MPGIGPSSLFSTVSEEIAEELVRVIRGGKGLCHYISIFDSTSGRPYLKNMGREDHNGRSLPGRAFARLREILISAAPP